MLSGRAVKESASHSSKQVKSSSLPARSLTFLDITLSHTFLGQHCLLELVFGSEAITYCAETSLNPSTRISIAHRHHA